MANTEQSTANGEQPALVDSPILAQLRNQDFRAALAAVIDQHHGALGRFCMALLSDSGRVEACLLAIFLGFREVMPALPRGIPILAELLRIARKQCARMTTPTDAAGAVPAGNTPACLARARLMQLRPSEREAVVLRVVLGLPHDHIAAVFGVEQGAAEERVSSALFALSQVGRPTHASAEPAFLRGLLPYLEARATAEQLDMLAERDDWRDWLFDVQAAVQQMAAAADDWSAPDGLSARILSAVGTAPEVAVSSPPIPTPTAPSIASPIIAVTAAMPSVEASGGVTAAPSVEASGGVTAAPSVEASGGVTAMPSVEASGGVTAAAKPPRFSLFSSPRRTVALAAVAVLLVAVVVVVWLRGRSHDVLSIDSANVALFGGQVLRVTPTGTLGELAICDERGRDCQRAKSGDSLRRGELTKTDGYARAVLRMDDGTELLLGRRTRLVLPKAGRVSGILETGSLLIDTERHPRQDIVLELPNATLVGESVKCVVRADDDEVSVEVSRGRARLTGRGGDSVVVREGERGRVVRGEAPILSSSGTLADTMASFEDVGEQQDAESESRGLGELRAKKPGAAHEQSDAVRLLSHQVRANIVGVMARTEIEEVFSNQTDEVLEGIFRFPLPADAQIERLALEVDGHWEEGAFVDRERAQAIWRGSIVNAAPQLKNQIKDEIIWVPGPWRDPALLEWQRGNRFELRIFPIPKRGSRRIILAYSQILKGSGGEYRYTYPLSADSKQQQGISDFGVRVEVRGFDKRVGIRSIGYPMKVGDVGEAAGLSLEQKSFVPAGDFAIEYLPLHAEQQLVAWAHQPAPGQDSKGYAAMVIRPRLPAQADDGARNYAFVVDTSRSMYGESLRRAASVTGRIIEELSPEERVVVLACDSECRTFDSRSSEPSEELAGRVKEWIVAQTAEGASDLAGAIAAGVKAAVGEKNGRGQVIYIGDAVPTMGPVRPASLTAAVRHAVGSTDIDITALGIGLESDIESLGAVARGGRGVVLPYRPGQSVAEVAYSALMAAYGQRLTDVRVELPSGLAEVTPEQPQALSAGGELLVAARMDRREVEGEVVLHGMLGKVPFVQRYPLSLRAIDGQPHAFVPRLFGASRIRDLESRGDAAAKTEAIALSGRLGLISRYTSLLVLESPAMFQAFGLDNRRSQPDWTGEEELTDFATMGEGEVADESTGLASVGASAALPTGGRMEAGDARPKAAPAAKPAAESPMPAVESQAPAAAPPPLGAERKRAAAAEMASDADGEVLTPSRAKRPSSRPGLGTVLVPQSGGRANDPLNPYEDSWVPMRRIWERQGSVSVTDKVPSDATLAKIRDAENRHAAAPEKRQLTLKLYDLYVRGHELEQASRLLAEWSAKDPLDVDALTRRADLAARQGQRALAIRILGSVVDVRPGEAASIQRLARLYRWSGERKLGCACSVAVSEFRPKDDSALLVVDRCVSESGWQPLGEQLLRSAEPAVRAKLDRRRSEPPPRDELKGDLRLVATWEGDSDVDLSLLHPDGHRVSWLGAPTRSIITATDVTSSTREGLGLSNAAPGQYVIAVVRGSGTGPVRGTVNVTAARATRAIPFELSGGESEKILGVVKVASVSRLVPVSSPWSR